MPAYVPVDGTAMVLNSLDIFANHERGSVEIAVAGAGIAQVDGIACARAAVAALITPDSAAAEPIVPTVKTPTRKLAPATIRPAVRDYAKKAGEKRSSVGV